MWKYVLVCLKYSKSYLKWPTKQAVKVHSFNRLIYTTIDKHNPSFAKNLRIVKPIADKVFFNNHKIPLHVNHKNKLKFIFKSALRLLDIFQQFTFVIKQKEQHTDLNIRKNTNRYNRQEQ